MRPSHPPATGELPDVNVWLALVHAGHPHHAAARRWWAERQGASAWFCRVTMLGLVRLLTQPRVMGEGVLHPAGALAVYEQISQAPGVGLLPEPATCEQAFRQLARPDLPARLLTDAYLAAFAQAASLRLVTFDRDFARFAKLDRLELS